MAGNHCPSATKDVVVLTCNGPEVMVPRSWDVASVMFYGYKLVKQIPTIVMELRLSLDRLFYTTAPSDCAFAHQPVHGLGEVR